MLTTGFDLFRETMELLSAARKRTSSLLNCASSCTICAARTGTTGASTMKFWPWRGATACWPTTGHVASMSTAIASITALTRLLRHASSLKTLSSCSLISKLIYMVWAGFLKVGVL